MSISNKVQDIIDAIKKLEIAEYLDLNESLMKEFGIDPSMLAASTGGASSGSAVPAEEVVKNVMLTEIKSKVGAIKAIRAVLGITSLVEANALHNDVVGGKPLLLKENAKQEDLKAIQASFLDDKGEAVGVVVLAPAA